MLNMAANCFSAAVFSPSLWAGMDGAGFWSASVRSAAACVIASTGERLGNFFCTRKISVVSEMCYDSVLDMYDIRHLYCIIMGRHTTLIGRVTPEFPSFYL